MLPAVVLTSYSPFAVFALPSSKSSSGCQGEQPRDWPAYGRGAAICISKSPVRARRRVSRRAEKESSAERTVVQGQSDRNLGELKLPSRYDGGDRDEVKPLVQERVASDLIRRYWLDDLSGMLRIEEVKTGDLNGVCPKNDKQKQTKREPLMLPFGILIPKVVTDFILPAGFPDSVSDEYLEYMLWQFPTNVTAWICSTLVTSSLFKAVGVGMDGGYAAAATATIKWVTKDGLGAVGLLLIGGRFGSIFDENPKQWRMYADVVGSLGGVFEICTPLAPDYFLLLASIGHLAKAIAKGLKDPSFRVIQNHFAVADNVGDVSAKEEVWEVSAKLVGLSLAVLLLGMPVLSQSYWKLLAVWASLRSFHLWLRYQSLSRVQFSTINYRRALVLIEAHLGGYSMPDCKECNKSEFSAWWQLMPPQVRIGCSLKDILEPSPSLPEVEELLKLYATEDYLLVLHPSPLYGLEARVLAKEGANGRAILRSLWQAYWLLLPSAPEGRIVLDPHSFTTPDGLVTSVTGRNSSISRQLVRLTISLEAMNHRFDSFLVELEELGWDLDKIVLKIPGDSPVMIL